MATTSSKAVIWAARVVSYLLVALFCFSAVMKISHNPQAVEGFTKLGIPLEALIPIGVVEILCALLFVIPPTAVLGAFLLTGYLGGAIMVHIIQHTAFIHALIIGILIWLATLIQVPRLRDLLPLVKSN